jgi:uncharacterized membrane protein
LSRNRIEALADGVFAVAMTLLVLDIKVPGRIDIHWGRHHREKSHTDQDEIK